MEWPFEDPHASRVDVLETDEKVIESTIRKREQAIIYARAAVPAKDEAFMARLPTAATPILKKIGFVGKNKGIKQILYERGLWKVGMKLMQSEKAKLAAIMNNKPLLDAELNASLVLDGCYDFQNEKSALADLVERRGHALLTSVKCHPEMAFGGIEYCWGCLKYTHRQNNEKQSEKRKGGDVFKETVRKLVIDKEVLPMGRIWKYQRRARDYHRLYMQLPGDAATSHTMLENMRKEYKTHRNIMEIEKAFILDEIAVAAIGNNDDAMVVHGANVDADDDL